MIYKILPYYDEMDKIIIPKNLYNKNICTLQAGMKQIDATFSFAEESSAKVIRVSHNLLRNLSIPLDTLYQAYIDGPIINIGPIIGILISKTNKQIRKMLLKKCLVYAVDYSKFNGLIILFSYEGIDFENRTVKGYYYKSTESGSNGHWEYGTFPMPNAIYRRQELSRIERFELKKAVDNGMFNSFYFNKLTLSKLAASSDILKTYIPETSELKSLDEVDTMLQKYASVYLKPVNGSGGKGIVRVTKKFNYFFETNETPFPIGIERPETASNFIKILKNRWSYLVQQGINSLDVESRILDFRVIMQKDENLQWKCSAIIAKVGKIDGICSNFKLHGYALPFEDAMSRATYLSESEIAAKKQELIDICKKVCDELDKIGENFGDFGIDAVIDKNFNIWVLEVNKKQDFSLLLSIYDSEKYVSVKSTPIRYAVGLSKFKFDTGDTKSQ